jgi:serine/threonine protein kinase
VVKAAIHKKTQKKVAIKIIKKAGMKATDLELVKREIEILKICQHPNIIRLLDIFENPDYIYIVMELLRGGDLFTYLEKRAFKITEIRACNIVHSLATALFYLHSYGIAHRDLKPENVLLVDESEDSDVKIVDFGLSKMVGPSEKCHEPFGTLSYVAPEVLLQQPYDKTVDLWSLGVVAYLLLSGTLPFDDDNEKEIVRYHLRAVLMT